MVSKLTDRDSRSTGMECNMQERSNDAQHILVNADRTAERIRCLKCGDTFAVFDHYGDIRPLQTGEEGLYYDGTRFLSCLTLTLDELRPLLLGSTVRDDNDQLIVTLTNPDLFLDEQLVLPANSLHISKRLFLLDATCYLEILVENYAFTTVNSVLNIQFSSDYKDIYEVRGMSRDRRGEDLTPSVEESDVTFRYVGLDDELRSTQIKLTPKPDRISRCYADFCLTLRSRETFTIQLAITCKRAL